MAHAFIIRIWCEPREIEGAPPKCRGVIEHVLTGERYYFQNLDDVLAFLVFYLERMDVKVELCWRVILRLRRWKKLLIE
jgi:hypothetical protein